MNALISFLRKRTLLILFLTAYFVFAFLTYKDFGITFDEQDVYLRGKLLYTKIKGNDSVLQKDFVIPSGTNEMLYYNNTYAGVLYLLNGSESPQQYHLFNLVLTSIIFILLYEVVLHETKKPLFALMGPFFLFFTPRFLGDIPANPKDIPFSVLYFLSLFFILFSRKLDEKQRILLLGMSFGLTQSSRIIGYTIYPVFVVFSLFERRKIIPLLFELICIFLIGFLVHVVSVPYLGADPFNNLAGLFEQAFHHPWNQKVLFFGNYLSPRHLPWSYVPLWLIITLPLSLLLLFIVGLFPKKGEGSGSILLRISIVTNIAIFLIVRPVIYDGVRHFLFIVPQIVAIATLGLSSLIRIKKIRKYILAIVAINLFLIVNSYVNIHPYEYIYFNELVGGVKGAANNFDLDYWGASNKEAALWLSSYLSKNQKGIAKVAVCGNSFSASYFFSEKMQLTADRNTAEYIICWSRYNEYKGINGTVLHEVKREGVTLARILKLK